MKSQLRHFKLLNGLLCLALFASACSSIPFLDQTAPKTFRRLPVAEYRNRMKAGWLGQMIGVSYGAPTEFRYIDGLMPQSDVPEFSPVVVNDSFNQDDLYVEMTFLRTLEIYGLNATSAQAGIDFANSEYQLWHANLAGRDNLRNGIAPPDSGHPRFNSHSDDIDYQIESDFAGLISPGMPNQSIRLGETFGQVMNYGDGVYAGQFMACMYSEAFFESEPEKLVKAGLACIPEGSQYAEAIRDVLDWKKENPEDWEKTWNLIQDKYQFNPAYRRSSCDDEYFGENFNIDAKINGAYVVLGLLYGDGDPLRSMQIAMRAGQDSDCNPSSANGVLYTSLGYEKLPEEIRSIVDTSTKWAYTDYNLDTLVDVCEKLARDSVINAGGKIEVDPSGEEIFVIPVLPIQPSPLVQSWNPGPISDAKFSDDQLAQIGILGNRLINDLKAFAPGWQVIECADNELLGLVTVPNRDKQALLTQPSTSGRCSMATSFEAATTSKLYLTLGYASGGEWELVVRGNGQELGRQLVTKKTAPEGWLTVEIDLSQFAGKDLNLEVSNEGIASRLPFAYWARLEVTH